MTGFRGKYLVTGYPNGDIMLYSKKKTQLGTLIGAHKHLIRTLFSLKRLNDAYFCSIDVCGVIKIWQSQPVPTEAMKINLESGVAYNSTLELLEFLPNQSHGILTEAAAIAVALKSNQVHILLIDPVENFHKLYCTLETSRKATSMCEMHSKLLAIAVGELGSPC